MQRDFQNKTVVITGACRGIGAGIAERFARDGANLVMVSNAERVHETAETLRQRREAIQSKMALARAQEKAASVMGSHTGADESKLGDAIARMENKADAMLDRSNAMQSLNEPPLDPAAELEKKYADATKNAAVEDELEKMKKEMGL